MIAGKGKLLGYEDVINERVHTASAKCISSESIILCGDAAEFIQKFYKDNLLKDSMIRLSYKNDLKTKMKLRDGTKFIMNVKNNTTQEDNTNINKSDI